MKKLIGYGRAWWLYVNTPKGRHDTLDYLRALAIIAASIAGMMWLVKLFGER